MRIEDIYELLAAGESETLEFKETTGGRREAARTLCAMLNHQGGQVLFGVSSDRKIVGQTVSDHTFERIAEELRRIEPAVFPMITRVALDAYREIIVISVDEGTAKPYQYRGTAYRRIGNTSPVMPINEFKRLVVEHDSSENRWENQPAAGWSVADLEVAEIQRTVREAVRRGRLDDPGATDAVDLLRGLKLLRGEQVMRAAAVLFGGPERLELDFPQCRLKVARFRGSDRTEFLDNRQFFGNALTLLRSAERFLRETLPIPGRIEAGRLERIDEPLVPPLATREALANAFCHRDYSIGGGSVGVAVYDDRLEISSSGSLHFGLTPEQLFEPHDSQPWNPRVARAFYLRGIIEEWGRGTLKMEAEALSAGLPRPQIEDVGGCVTVRFRFRAPMSRLRASIGLKGTRSIGTGTGIAEVFDADDPQRNGLSEVQRAVLDLLESGRGPLALREIRAEFPDAVSQRQIRRALSRLRELGLAVSSGRGAIARWGRVVSPSES